MNRFMIWLTTLLAVFAVNLATPVAAFAKSQAQFERTAERHVMRHHRHLAGRHHHHHGRRSRHHHWRHHHRHYRVRVIHHHHHHDHRR